jgi:O-antigen/teichoic acid export membrane protein
VTSSRGVGFAGRYAILLGGELVSKLAVLGAFVYLARTTGPRVFGLVELALAITLFFTLGVDGGVGAFGARVLAREPQKARTLVPAATVLRGVLALPAYLGILVISGLYGTPGIGIIAVYGLAVLIVPFLYTWVFQGLGQMQAVALGSVVRYVTFFVVIIATVRPDSGPVWVAIAEIAGLLALMAVHQFALPLVVGRRLAWRTGPAGAPRLLRESWTIAASDVTWAALWYAPGIVLAATELATNTDQVAWLAGPLRIVMALHTGVWLYFFTLLPELSRSVAEGPDTWRQLARRSLASSMWIGLLVAGAGTLLAPLVIGYLYGQAFAPAVLPLQILIWMVPVAWLSGHFRYTLVASGHQRQEFQAAAVTAVVTVAAAWVLAARWQSVGAAAALLFGGVLNTVLAAVAVRRCVASLAWTGTIVPPLSACAACVLIGWQMGPTAGACAFTLYALIAAGVDPEFGRLRRQWLGR